MKKKMAEKITQMSALALCLGLLAGCGAQQTPEAENQTVQEEVSESEAAEETEETGSQEEGLLVYENNEKLEAAIDAVTYSYVKNALATSNNKVVPGAQMIVVKDGKIVFEKSYGVKQAYDWSTGEGVEIENPEAVDNTTLFDLASCSKITGTTQAIMKLVSEGKVDVKEKVATYLPEFAENGKENVTVEELLTHTSGLPQWRPMFLYCNTKEEVRDYICGEELMFEPGEYKYSDLGFMTLGFIVEKVSGQDLDDYVENNIFKPLGMENTMYTPLEKGVKKEDIAVSSYGNPYELMMVDEENYPDFGYDCTEDKEAFEAFDGWRNYTLQGEVNDGNAGMGCQGVAGHAGVYSNVEELAVLYQTMLNGGEWNGTRIYDADVIDQFVTERIAQDLTCYGFATGNSWQNALNEGAFGHNGFTGQYITVDPENQIITILLTNKMNAGQTDSGSYNNLTDFAKAFNNAVRNEYINN